MRSYINKSNKLFYPGIAIILILGTFAVIGYRSSVFAQGIGGDASATVALTGNEEVPPAVTSASGTLMLTLDQSDQRMSYTLNVQNGVNITAAHLHCGRRGESGAPIVNLYSDQGRNVNGELARGNFGVNDLLPAAVTCSPNIRTLAHLKQAMREGKIYANVHSASYPNGEIRGQVMLTKEKKNGNGKRVSPPPGAIMTLLQAKDLVVYEVGTTETGRRMFMISISDSLLGDLEGLLRHLFGILDKEQIRVPGMQWPSSYNLNEWYGMQFDR